MDVRTCRNELLDTLYLFLPPTKLDRPKTPINPRYTGAGWPLNKRNNVIGKNEKREAKE